MPGSLPKLPSLHILGRQNQDLYETASVDLQELEERIDPDHGAATVAEACSSLLTLLENKTRDLRLGVQLVQGLTWVYGYAGLAHGLSFLNTLSRVSWRELYPRCDASGRAEVVTRGQHLIERAADSIPRFETTSRAIWTLSPEEIQKAIRDTPTTYFEEALRSLSESLNAIKAIDDFFLARSGRGKPNALESPAYKPVLILPSLYAKLQHRKNEIAVISEDRHNQNTLGESTSAGVVSTVVAPAHAATSLAPARSLASSEGGITSTESASPRLAAPNRPTEVSPAAPAPDEAVDVLETARALAKTGSGLEAVDLMHREIGKASSARDRFLAKFRLAQICRTVLDPNAERVACELLTALAAEIEDRNLQEWESAEFLLPVYEALYRSLKTLNRTEQQEKVFGRICRIAPRRALEVTR